MVLRRDLEVIADLIVEREKILDVGCGEGSLIHHLQKCKSVDCRGIELSQNGVNKCVSKGLSVIQGDANLDLKDYPDGAFSTVILSQTIHAMLSPDQTLRDLIRIGNRAIVSLPNFGYWKVRTSFLFKGTMPKNKILPYEWYNTPNIHLCSIKDFENLCKIMNLKINTKILLNERGQKLKNSYLRNLFSFQGIFCLSKE
tara:strand:- start:13654 stop:14250 length:597 start_codon:yes stop_codon:yes gene_type:complete